MRMTRRQVPQFPPPRVKHAGIDKCTATHRTEQSSPTSLLKRCPLPARAGSDVKCSNTVLCKQDPTARSGHRTVQLLRTTCAHPRVSVRPPRFRKALPRAIPRRPNKAQDVTRIARCARHAVKCPTSHDRAPSKPLTSRNASQGPSCGAWRAPRRRGWHSVERSAVCSTANSAWS